MDICRTLLEKIDGQKPKIRSSVKVWYVNDSKLWYLTDEQAEGYLQASHSDEYKSGMQDAETNLIERNLDQIVDQLEMQVKVIDLGCGEALKTLKILRETRQRGKQVIFYPVDISPRILDLAIRNAEEAGIETYGLQEDFEQLDQLLSKTKQALQTFYFLGANFVNFNSDSILSTLKANMRSNDVIYFSAQTSDGRISDIVAGYSTSEARNFAFQTIKQLGFGSDDVSYNAKFNEDTRGVETYFTINRIPEKLRKSKLSTGDEIIVTTSYKPTLKDFTLVAEKYFAGELLFNENRNYVGFLGRIK